MSEGTSPLITVHAGLLITVLVALTALRPLSIHFFQIYTHIHCKFFHFSIFELAGWHII